GGCGPDTQTLGAGGEWRRGGWPHSPPCRARPPPAACLWSPAGPPASRGSGGPQRFWGTAGSPRGHATAVRRADQVGTARSRDTAALAYGALPVSARRGRGSLPDTIFRTFFRNFSQLLQDCRPGSTLCFRPRARVTPLNTQTPGVAHGATSRPSGPLGGHPRLCRAVSGRYG